MAEPLIVDSTSKHTATFIFVHGLGGSGASWLSVVRMLSKDSGLSHVKWVLPNAPTMAVTCNMGKRMPAWFDIKDTKFRSHEDEDGMLKTVSTLNAIITDEVSNGVPISRIILGGFSQGGTMSLLTGLTNERKLGGIVCLSGRVPLRDKFGSMITDTAKEVPIFWGTGTDDPLIQFDLVTTSKQLLIDAGVKAATGDSLVGITFKSYEGLDHYVNPEELSDLGAWLKRVVGDN